MCHTWWLSTALFLFTLENGAWKEDMTQIEKLWAWPYLSIERADRQGTGEEALLRPPLLTAQGAACHIDTQQGQHGCLQQLLQVGVRDVSDKHIKKKAH